jgi:hypothetical protein
MDFQTRFGFFMMGLQNLYNEYYAANYAVLTPPRIEAMVGKKYIRVVVQDMNADGTTAKYGRSVYCFVDKNTGDIYKSAGWAAPAKHVRGSIWNENCDIGTKCTVHGGGLYIR